MKTDRISPFGTPVYRQKHADHGCIYWRLYYVDPTTDKRHRKMEHIVVWEEAFGSLPPGYVVHHEDGNGSNNELSNLRAMSVGAHIRLHHYIDGLSLDNTAYARRSRLLDPGKWRRWGKAHYERVRNDPERWQKVLEDQRRVGKDYYDRLRADPVRWQSYLARKRKTQRAQRESKRTSI